jgi:hypothetical protein
MGCVLCCLFFLLSFNGVWLYAIQQVAQAGWSQFCLGVMGHCFYLYVSVIIFFNSLWTTSSILFDPEVVAHDAYCDEGGLFKFSFWLLEQYSFLGGWNLYRYYSAKKL